jgi:polysaccharide biosynthesis protein PelA
VSANPVRPNSLSRREFLGAAVTAGAAAAGSLAAGPGPARLGPTPGPAARPDGAAPRLAARPGPAAAAWAPVAGEVSRRVLGLYKSYEIYNAVEGKRPKTARLNEIHVWAQMPLNWLGLVVEYHDVALGLPSDAVMNRYLGVITWFQTDEIDDPLGYLRWLAAQMRAGRRVVIVGTLGAFRDRKSRAGPSLADVSAALGPAGLEFRGNWTANQRAIELRFKDPRLLEFERKLPPALPNYFQVVSRGPNNRVHLTLGRRDLPDSDSHLVVTGPWGGFAGNAYVMYLWIESFGTQWWIDPFEFFQRSLGIADWPRPDVTTLNGRRILYSHIDGDGLRNRSEIGGAMSGEVILDQILSRYPLPVAVSVVTAEVDPERLGSPQTLALARRMLALPNVEAGSHSFSHPLDWEKQTRSFEMPGYRYSVEMETAGSIEYIEKHLLPAGKRVRLFQWSGAANVVPEAFEFLERLGVPNINGGDPMFDREWPSYSRLAPLMQQVGSHWQTYTSAANENLYTNAWRGPFYGYREVVQTFNNTETPRRVSPINIYYHFYSGERIASLSALRHVHDWALRQPVAPIFTSEYLAIVEGFRSARLARTGEGWRVWDHGDLRTIRFDSTRAAVDMSRSRGVLGWIHHQGSLYVHLAGPEEVQIVLAERPGRTPHLASASHRVAGWQRLDGVVSFRLVGVGPKSAEIGGLSPGTEHAVELTDRDGVRRARLRSGPSGTLPITAGDGDGGEVGVRVS